MKRRKEMSQLKETMRLENEEQERLWDRKQKQKNYPHVGVTVISIIPQVLNVQFR